MNAKQKSYDRDPVQVQADIDACFVPSNIKNPLVEKTDALLAEIDAMLVEEKEVA